MIRTRFEPPNKRRNLVHKRIVAGIGGFIGSGGNPFAAAKGFISGGGGSQQQQLFSPVRRTFSKAENDQAVRECGEGRSNRNCRDRVRQSFGATPLTQHPITLGGDIISGPSGTAIMGRFGAGMAPGVDQRVVLECLPGMVLGKDEVCYNRKDIANKDRKYPKGRAPLLTGGERNCITRAAAAARKIDRTRKQLEKMGMLKKASRPAARKAPLRLAAPSDGVRVVNVE